MRDGVASFDLAAPDVFAEWVGVLTELDAGFVVLDCLRPILDAMGLDEDREASRFLTPFGELLARSTATGEGAVVQHMGHNEERARGSSVLLAWPDALWKLVRQDPHDPASPRYFSAYGRDVDVSESLLTFDGSTNRLALVGGNRKDAAARDAVPAVLALLCQASRLNGTAIEKELREQGIPNKLARAAVKLAIRDGSVTVTSGARGAHLHSLALQLGSSADLVTARQTGSNDLGSSSYRAAEVEVELRGSSSARAEDQTCTRSAGRVPTSHEPGGTSSPWLS